MGILESLKGQVIVSSQAMPDEPLYKEECMLAMMQSVVNGGAGGLRVAGARDVRNAKTRKEKEQLKIKIKKIKETAIKNQKGEEHGRTGR